MCLSVMLQPGLCRKVTHEASLIATERVIPIAATDPMDGQIALAPAKTLWLAFHSLAGLAGILLYPQMDAALVFVVLTVLTICAGHSVGMHRLLIHRSFKTHRWVARLLVWFGTLVGMAGPLGMIRAHDMRDWHQQQSACPPHPSHTASFWRDAYWQLCCVFELRHPPRLKIEPEVADDPIYRWIERTWMIQQLPPALILFAFGGWAYVFWGVSLRVAVSLIGHWMVGHFAHKSGHQGWCVDGLPVQGYNLRHLGLITFGENWHGNHHAFPYSARLGLEPGQADPGYWLIRALAFFGLAWDVKLPGDQPDKKGLIKVRQV